MKNNETLLKLSTEARADFAAKITDKIYSDIVAKTKEASDSDAGTFKAIVSTADIDRAGESVSQSGWDLTFYKMNPVVLWAHDYSQLPIGVCTSIEVKDGKLVAEGKFAPSDANPFAQQVRKLYDLGMVCATSVGFIPKEYDQKADGVINKSELLEFSFVPVPANPYALSVHQIKELKIDTSLLKTKGIEIKETTTETPVVPEPEKKGEIAEQLEEMKNTKWGKYRAVYDLMDALACCYFSDATPADDFSKLVLEASEILKAIASGAVTTEVEEKTKKLMGKAEPLIILRSNVILGNIMLSEGGKKNEGNRDIIPSPKVDLNGLKEISAFVESRELLRSIDKSVEKVLGNFNAAARTRLKI